MSMETLTTDRIQKAFQDLENQKSAIANCSLLWKSFSDYCSSIKKALEGRSQAIDSKLEAMEFETKQAMESINERESSFPEREAAAVKLIADRRDSAIAEIESSSSQIPRNIDGILRWYCRRMDSSGLWRFMLSRRRELEISRTEISEAMAETLDPPRLVIDAVQDFINSADAASIASGGEKFWGLNELLKALLDLTEKSSMEMSGSIRDRAEEVAVNWKEKYEGKKGGNGNEGGLEGAEARIFLKMVVAFGIRSKFKDAFLLKLVVENSSRKDVGKLAGRLQFGKKIEGKTFETRDPRNGELIANVAEGDKHDIDLAVKSAREAFDHGIWPRQSGFQRGRIMMKFADLIDQNRDELAIIESLDSGKLLHLNKLIDIPSAANSLRYYAGSADKIHGETLKCSGEYQGYTLKEPIGVAGIIIPWNFPSIMFFSKVAPALAAGCTMVVKPAEQTPLTALCYADLAKQAGIPDGVLNVITGYGSTAGAALSSHMDVDTISFTGSTDVGRLIMEAAARSNLKPVSLELGGKSPLIICNDVDVDMAINIAKMAIFFNKGEICIAGSRVFVQEGIHDEFVKKIKENLKSWVVGDPFDSNVNQGPQVDKSQFEKVLRYIEHGKQDGATLLTGGKPCGENGYFIEPTIFIDVKEDMLIAKDEIFGPVMSLMKFKTIDEVIEKANNTIYGLAAGILTNDINIANRVSRSIRAGLVWINCYTVFDRDCPYGGYKMSGFGRDLGMRALDKYLQEKTVIVPIYGSPWL